MTEIHLGEAVFSLGVATSIYAGNRVRWWIKRKPRKDPLIPIMQKVPPTKPYSRPPVSAKTRERLRKAALNRSPEVKAKYAAHAKTQKRVGGKFK